VIDESATPKPAASEQLDFFTDYKALDDQKNQEETELQREKNMQSAMLTIKKKFGKNAILKGTNLEEDATTIDRNKQIGGHKA
jgi:DNA polymerase V